jgi:ribulose-phosphate 3-epimerase
MTVLPIVNVQSAEEAAEKIKKAAEFTDLIHLDIEDGVFLPRSNWGSPAELKKVMDEIQFREVEPPKEIRPPRFELHLMVSNPEGVIDSWLRTGVVKRIIVHLEAMTDSVYILEKCKKYGAEAMLAINPGTEAERLLAHNDDFSYFQTLAVQPGPSGQKFDAKILDKIRFIKARMPDAIIEVDGGVNLETAKMVKEAGAEIVVSDSYIFKSENPQKAYKELKNA